MLGRRDALRCMFVASASFVSCRTRREETIVFGAASTKGALDETARAFGRPVRCTYGGSNELARQIEAGAHADAFLSADEAQIDRLTKGGFVNDGDRRDLLANRLVVVVPSDSNAKVSGPSDLSAFAKIATGDPTSVPVGVYAKAWLEKANAWSPMASKIVATVDVGAALAAVESAAVDAAIVYATDARASSNVRVAYEVPIADAPPIRYPIAAISGSKNGRDFVSFAASDTAAAIFAKYGFARP